MQFPVSGITDAARSITAAVTTVSPGGKAPAESFANVLRDAVAQVHGLEADATKTVDGLITGQGVDVHTALIATQKADAAFEMALSMRNKAVGAYQQLMATQF